MFTGEFPAWRQKLIDGHWIKNMLIDCKFNFRENCSIDDFVISFNMYYGNCFTINAKDNGRELTSYQPGPLFGKIISLSTQPYLSLSSPFPLLPPFPYLCSPFIPSSLPLSLPFSFSLLILLSLLTPFSLHPFFSSSLLLFTPLSLHPTFSTAYI